VISADLRLGHERKNESAVFQPFINGKPPRRLTKIYIYFSQQLVFGAR
jgi:hypothetical protein